jgi:hypothetical protein
MTSEGPHVTDSENRRFVSGERRQRQVAKKLSVDTMKVQQVSLYVGWHVFDLEGTNTMHIVQSQSEGDSAQEPLHAWETRNLR